jgi:GT2 family glycosyltransferase
MAAHWFMSISCIERIGGFSPSFVHGAEDNNYIERVRFHGLKIGIVPASLGIHDSQTLKKNNSISSNYLNLVQYISNPQGVNYRLIFRTMLTTVHFVFIYKTFSPLKNIFKFMKNKRQFDENRRLSQQGRAFL